VALDFPASPTLNQTFPGPNGVTWSWDGAKWTDAAVSGSPPGGAVIAATPPAVTNGSLWWDSTGGQLYVGFNDGNSTQWVVASNIPGLANAATKADVAGALSNVGRNVLHNSLFAIAQRGQGPWTANTNYTLDRWVLSLASDTASISQLGLTDTDRTQLGDEAATYCLRNAFTGNAAAGAYNTITEWVEGVRRLAGKTVTVSFWASCASGTPKLGVSIDQYFGTPGGGGSAQVNGTGQSITLSTTWTRYSLTFAVPSASGKTLSSSASDCSGLNFWFSSGATNATRSGSVGVQSGTVFLWGVQCEIGTQATPLEKPDPRYDLANCQRFYQSHIAQVQGSVYAAGGFISTMVGLPVALRSTTVTLVPSWAAPTNAQGPSLTILSGSQLMVGCQSVAAGLVIQQCTFTASADL
jgi:hypothetical protein